MAWDVLAGGAHALLSSKVVSGGVCDILASVHGSAPVAMDMASCKLVWARVRASRGSYVVVSPLVHQDWLGMQAWVPPMVEAPI